MGLLLPTHLMQDDQPAAFPREGNQPLADDSSSSRTTSGWQPV
jgi:hypothetical protein